MEVQEPGIVVKNDDRSEDRMMRLALIGLLKKEASSKATICSNVSNLRRRLFE